MAVTITIGYVAFWYTSDPAVDAKMTKQPAAQRKVQCRADVNKYKNLSMTYATEAIAETR